MGFKQTDVPKHLRGKTGTRVEIDVVRHGTPGRLHFVIVRDKIPLNTVDASYLAGEGIGILAGPNPAEVQSGLRACAEFMASGVGFRSANEDGSIVYFAHTVSRTGTYLSKTAGVREGEALAYLIAPPLEAVVGLDEALKASDVELAALFEPPSETNFGGGLLTGTQSACNAACAAFAEAVKAVAARPREI